jgi:cytidylate kinase
MLDFKARGENPTFEEVIAQQNERDEQDRTRETGRLIAAPDAIEVCTDGMSPAEVVDRLEQIARSRQCQT